jgi:hypothetical protein
LSTFCNGLEKVTVGAFWVILSMAVVSLLLPRVFALLDRLLVAFHAATLGLATAQAFVIAEHSRDVLPIWWSWALLLYLATLALFVVSACCGRSSFS